MPVHSPRLSSSSSLPSPRRPSHSSSDPPQCRICHESTADSPERPLFRPCKCRGSVAYVHQDCLTHWLSIKRAGPSASSSSPSASAACEICHHPFTFISEVRGSAPEAPGWWDAAAGLGEGIKEAATALVQWMSWRHLLALLIIPLCPHLSQQPAPGGADLLGLTSTVLSLLYFLSVNVLLLSASSFVLVFLLMSSLHGFVCFWGHEIHILVHRLKKKLRAFSAARRRERGQRGEVGDPRVDEVEDALSDLYLDRLIEGINLLSSIDSMQELLHLTYLHHLAVSTCFLVLPYIIMRWLAHLTAFIPLLNLLPSLSSLSYFALSSAVSIVNGGLPLLLPDWMVEPYHLPSVLLHFTEESLMHLHAVLHLAPILRLTVWWTVIALWLLCWPWRHPLQLLASVCFSVLVKVVVLMTCEFLLIPVVMGVIVHACLLPLFLSPSASLSALCVSHVVHGLSSPLSAVFVHWVLGTAFFILSTSFFRLLIRVTRRRVISLIFQIHPRNDLMHEIVATSMWKESRKILRSFCKYAGLCLAVVGLGSVGVAGVGRGLGLPVRVEGAGVLSWMICFASVGLFVWKVWVGGKEERRERLRRGKQRVERLLRFVSSYFGLSSYILKDDTEKEQELEERRERRRGMRQRRLLQMEEGEEDQEPFPFVDEPAPDDVDSNDDTEDEIEQWMQAAELDHVLIEAEEERAMDDPDGVNDDWDDDAEDELLNANFLQQHPVHQDLHSAIAATVARRERDRAEREAEKQERAETPFFFCRLLGTLLSLWALALAVIVPGFLVTLWVGRAMVMLVPVSWVSRNDVFALMAGYLVLAHLPTRKMLAALGSASARLAVAKGGLLAVYFVVLFPLCMGLLTQHILLLPFRLSLHQQPLFYPSQEWAIGMVGSLFLGAGMMLVQSLLAMQPRDPPPPTPLTFFSSFSLWHAHVAHFLSQPLAHTRLLSLLYDVLLPPSQFFILHLALPYVIVRGLIPLRLLLPWWVRCDEFLLVSYLQGDEGMALTSRLLESALYRWTCTVVLCARVAGWLAGWGRQWWEEYKAAAFERRWGMRRLRNVEEDDQDHAHNAQEADQDWEEGDAEEAEEQEQHDEDDDDEEEQRDDDWSDAEEPGDDAGSEGDGVRWHEEEQHELHSDHEEDDAPPAWWLPDGDRALAAR